MSVATDAARWISTRSLRSRLMDGWNRSAVVYALSSSVYAERARLICAVILDGITRQERTGPRLLLPRRQIATGEGERLPSRVYGALIDRHGALLQ